jgi:hypothetical protein
MGRACGPTKLKETPNSHKQSSVNSPVLPDRDKASLSTHIGGHSVFYHDFIFSSDLSGESQAWETRKPNRPVKLNSENHVCRRH